MEESKNKKKIIKIIDKVWTNSYIINKHGARTFSFSYFRNKIKENNITEEELSTLLLDVKPMLEEVGMPVKEFVQWIFHPTEDVLNVENYLNDVTPSELSSRLSSLNIPYKEA